MAKLFAFQLQSQRIGSSLITKNPFRTREQMIEQAKLLRKEGAENIQPFMWSDVSGWIDDDVAVQALNTEPVAEQRLTFSQAAELLSEFSKLKRKLNGDEKEALAEILASVYHITELDLYPTSDTLDLMEQINEERVRAVFSFGVSEVRPIICGMSAPQNMNIVSPIMPEGAMYHSFESRAPYDVNVAYNAIANGLNNATIPNGLEE